MRIASRHIAPASRRIPAQAEWCVDIPITSGVMSTGNVVVAFLELLGWENADPGLGVARMCIVCPLISWGKL